MRALLFFSLLTISASVYAQVPVIETVVPYSTFPNDTVVISGRGFDTNPANLDVWFEAVKGTIVESTDFSIVVVVPPQAKFGAVEVINKASRLSGKSIKKFTPSFPLGSFSSANFPQAYTLAQTDEFWDLCTCDLNNDGKPEISTSKIKRSSFFGTPSDLSVFQNNSTPGTMAFAHFNKNNLAALNLGFTTDNIVCGDLNGDGKPELVFSRSGGNRNTIAILPNTTAASTITFGTRKDLFMDAGALANRIILRDLNNDGKPEVIATNLDDDIFYIFVNESTGGALVFNTILKISIKVSPTDVLTTYEPGVLDVNGDKLPDIVINQLQTANFYVLRNTSAGSISFATAQKVDLPGALNRFVSADFNMDGKLDLVFTNTGTQVIPGDKAILVLNESTGNTITFGTPIELATSFEPWGIDAGDIDGDKDPDFVVVNRNRPTPVASELDINIFLNNGGATPTFTRADITTTSPGRNVKLTDMDGDSKADIVYTSFDESAGTSRVNVLRNTNCFKPPIINEAPLTICNGQTIRLQSIAVSGTTYTWKNGAATVGSNLPYLDITSTGSYTVTATAGTCAETSDPITVTTDVANAPADPVITGGDDPICVGGTLDLSTSATADAYFWTGPNNFTSSLKDPPSMAVSIESAGYYKLQTQVGFCKSNEVSKLIEVVNLEDFEIYTNAPSTTLCAGESISIYVNDLRNFTFDWFKDGVAFGSPGAILSASQEGAYTVRISPPASVDCAITTTDAFNIVVYTTPVAEFTSLAQECLGESVSFTNTSQVDPDATVVYAWNFDDAGTSPDQNPSHLYAAAGTYDVTLTASYTGVTGCSDDVTHPVTIVTPVVPEIIASETSVCPGVEVTLTIAAFPSILWNTTETTTSITVTPGNYSVATTDANGCAGADAIAIDTLEVPDLTATADPTEVLAGRPSQLTATGAASYQWTPGSTLSDSLISNPIATPLTTTTYTVTGTSIDGCTAELDIQVVVDGVPGFPVAFSPNGDGQNEVWDIQANFNPECTISIFDGRGRRVFEAKGENWDGTYKGSAAPEGTYYYVYSCPGDKRTGTVLLFR